MDGAIGLVRVAFDFSVWPVDGHAQTAGSANIFTSAEACGGSTCIPWEEAMTADSVVGAVVSHVLHSVATTASGGGGDRSPRAVTLRSEWSRVLRLALVVDHAAPGRARAASALQQPASLVLINPTTPLMQQPNVIQSLRTGGTIRTLETAIVVIPYDDQAERQAAARHDVREQRRRRQLVAEASAEDVNRRLAQVRARDDAVAQRSAALRAQDAKAITGPHDRDRLVIVGVRCRAHACERRLEPGQGPRQHLARLGRAQRDLRRGGCVGRHPAFADRLRQCGDAGRLALAPVALQPHPPVQPGFAEFGEHRTRFHRRELIAVAGQHQAGLLAEA